MSVADRYARAARGAAALVMLALCTARVDSAPAQTPEVPPLILEGLQAYGDGGADSAVAVWFREGPIDSPESRATMQRAFDTMHRQAGAFSGFDIVKTVAIGSHVCRVFAVLHYDLRPGFLLLDVYRSPTGWTLQNMSFNDTAEKVFPSTLLIP